MISSKIAIGSVQWGLDYGISNKFGRVSETEVFHILDLATQNGINSIDTAPGYGDAEKVIGEWIESGINDKPQIISKYPPPYDNVSDKLLLDSIERLKVNKLYGYLAHDFKAFGYNVSKINSFLQLKRSGYIDKIGFSLYYPDDVKFLLDNNLDFDLVQVPYNVFDQRFNSTFSTLKEHGIEIHVRSCFLQGLVFMKSTDLPPKLVGMAEGLGRLSKLAENSNHTISSLCINFCILNRNVDKLILGVDNLQHLRSNLLSLRDTLEDDTINQLSLLREDNELLILPINW